ncbi:MAG: hypothetical protein ACYSTT_17620, partial [Planctomycetota bacterium]
MIYEYFVIRRDPISIGKRFLLSLILLSFVFISELGAASINLLVDDTMPQAVFAAGDIQAALKTRGHNVKQHHLTQLSRVADGVRIVLSLSSNEDIIRAIKSEGTKPPGALKSEGYSIRKSTKSRRTNYWIVG